MISSIFLSFSALKDSSLYIVKKIFIYFFLNKSLLYFLENVVKSINYWVIQKNNLTISLNVLYAKKEKIYPAYVSKYH